MAGFTSRGLSIALLVSVASAVLLACGGSTPPPAAPAGVPGPEPTAEQPKAGASAIPHDLVGKEDCGSCHKVGEGTKPLSDSHKGRDNATCKGCHQPKAG